jgi:hypothetical protein
MEDATQPELKDVQEMIRRFLVVNGNDVIFIADFLAFDRKSRTVKDGITCVYGDKKALIEALNSLRDMIEDAADEEGFVNI